MEMRALVPGPTIISRLTTLAALDREEKTTARVVVDASTLHGGAELPVRLELHELRGYGREADRLLKRLTDRHVLVPGRQHRRRRGPAAVGRAAVPALEAAALARPHRHGRPGLAHGAAGAHRSP